jgi:hypothetical protein
MCDKHLKAEFLTLSGSLDNIEMKMESKDKVTNELSVKLVEVPSLHGFLSDGGDVVIGDESTSADNKSYLMGSDGYAVPVKKDNRVVDTWVKNVTIGGGGRKGSLEAVKKRKASGVVGGGGGGGGGGEVNPATIKKRCGFDLRVNIPTPPPASTIECEGGGGVSSSGSGGGNMMKQNDDSDKKKKKKNKCVKKGKGKGKGKGSSGSCLPEYVNFEVVFKGCDDVGGGGGIVRKGELLDYYFKNGGWIKGIFIGEEFGWDNDWKGPLKAVRVCLLVFESVSCDSVSSRFKMGGHIPFSVTGYSGYGKLVGKVSREDFWAESRGDIDLEGTSLAWKAHRYFLKHGAYVKERSWPYLSLSLDDRQKYRELVCGFAEDRMAREREYRFKSMELRGWQRQVLDRLRSQPDRLVTWVFDPVGNTGKSALAEYLRWNSHICPSSPTGNDARKGRCDTLVLGNHSTSDVAEMVKRYYSCTVFDFCRADERCVNYQVIEYLKNGVIPLNTKSGNSVFFPPQRVLVLANFLPLANAFSVDRYDIIVLNDKLELRKYVSVSGHQFKLGGV